jgi:DNA primase
MIEQASIETLKNRLDIIDVVGRYLELKKAGANFKAPCPFHDENSPSFVVSPSKQIYHCFGCGAGGDSIKFVMEYENLNYPEAIEKLASEYNVQLQYTQNDRDKHYHDRKVLDNYNLFFRKQLTQNPEALAYFHGRGVYDSSIEKFELGYAPHSQESLKYLNESGVGVNEALKLGIIAKSEDGRIYARFSKRITFPVFTAGGKLVGFGGRIIDQRENVGKYINSPTTNIFDKSTLLYGYHKAKTTIMKTGEIIIVEGNLDVVMLHQAGFTNAVATLGTALTEKHIPLLKRGDPRIILAYDGDSAGVAAAFKAASMLSHRGMHGGVVIFKKGVDPADMVKEGKEDELKALFSKTKGFIEFCLEHIISQYDTHNPVQKEVALKEAVKYLNTLSPMLQDEYKAYLSAILGVQERHIRIQQAPHSQPTTIEGSHHSNEDIAELSIIKTLLTNPNMIDRILNVISSEIFQTHKRELDLVIGNEIDHPLLVGVDIRDDIRIYSDSDFTKQIIFLLRRHYNNELKKINAMTHLSLSEKSFIIRKIREVLNRLQKGELVPYESFLT